MVVNLILMAQEIPEAARYVKCSLYLQEGYLQHYITEDNVEFYLFLNSVILFKAKVSFLKSQIMQNSFNISNNNLCLWPVDELPRKEKNKFFYFFGLLHFFPESVS